MIIDNKFDLGSLVYLKTDKEQLPRVVIGILINPSRTILYRLAQSTTDNYHFEQEISKEKDVMLSTSN